MRPIGIGLLAMVPILWGYYRRELLLREGRYRAALLHFFETIEFEIDAFTRGQDQIFLQFRDRELERLGFLPQLRVEVEIAPCGALRRAMDVLFDALSLSQREKEALEEFGTYFGLQSKAAQLRDCKKLLFLLQSEEEKRGAKRKADASVAWTTGLCGGVGLFILLI